ncbi:zinc dependent phospholipase C family protein [Luxibacter massiliensis]|uniref:zinc dependent phospholipase C family protein n=1 Tax=Luxibacter massiliensis TaxID=2219695 RepID=UPI000F04667B|nr:zinc dependent phospholipase C family protein [Luxibacter massiliensis]
MPTTYAHYRFGKDVITTLPKRVGAAIENNRELFDIGLHGPDILFYYNPLSKNPVNQQGYEMHDRTGDEFFRRAAEIIKADEDSAAARAYIYGFICHFALDSECHKYIEKMIQVSKLSHAEIEMEFDRYLLTEDHINPLTYLGTRHIHPTIGNAEVIAPFFQDVSAEIIKKSLVSMIICHRLLLAPGQAKRKVLAAAMKVSRTYDSMYGMVMSEQANPQCQKYCLLLKKLYAGAVPLAVDLIIKFQKVLFQDGELPVRFHETFGAGENWEALPL